MPCIQTPDEMDQTEHWIHKIPLAISELVVGERQE